MFKNLFFAAVFVLALTTGHAYADDSMDDYTQDEGMLESYNRAMFSFNSGFNDYVLIPVSKGYRAITTPFIRNRVSGVLANLREPISMGNYILQGEFKKSGIVLSRFVINSTLGLLGMFDVAEGWGLPNDTTSFDDTFATWCIPDGPYIVLPFFGSSTPRAAIGMSLGFAMDPVFWATNHDANINSKISYSYAAMQAISLMERNVDMYEDLERNSVDFYATMKSAYMQNRQNKGCVSSVSASPAATYDFDFGIEEEEEDVFKELLVKPAAHHRMPGQKPELLVNP